MPACQRLYNTCSGGVRDDRRFFEACANFDEGSSQADGQCTCTLGLTAEFTTFPISRTAVYNRGTPSRLPAGPGGRRTRDRNLRNQRLHHLRLSGLISSHGCAGASRALIHFVARINSRAQSAPAATFYVRRTYSGRPSSSIRFSEATAMATSVVCRPSERSEINACLLLKKTIMTDDDRSHRAMES